MLVGPADQARKEIRDMIDAITSVVGREHAVDQSFVISEIKAYISSPDFAERNGCDLKLIQYARKQKPGVGSLSTAMNMLRSKVQRISLIRFSSYPHEGSN